MIILKTVLGELVTLTPGKVRRWLEEIEVDPDSLPDAELFVFLDLASATYGQFESERFLRDFRAFNTRHASHYDSRRKFVRSMVRPTTGRGRLHRSPSLRRRSNEHLQYLKKLSGSVLNEIALNHDDVEYELAVRATLKRAQNRAAAADLPPDAFQQLRDKNSKALDTYVSGLPSIGALAATEEEITILRYLCSALSEEVTTAEVPWVPGVLGIARVDNAAVVGVGFSGSRDGHLPDAKHYEGLNTDAKSFYDAAKDVIDAFNEAGEIFVAGTSRAYELVLAHPLALDPSTHYPTGTRNADAICAACRAFVAANAQTNGALSYDTWADTGEARLKRLDAFVPAMVLEVTAPFFTNPIDEDGKLRTREPLDMTIAVNFALFDAKYSKKERKELRRGLKRSNSYSSLMKSCDLCKRDRVAGSV